MAQLPGTRQLVLATLALRFQPLVLACTMAKQGAKKAAKKVAKKNKGKNTVKMVGNFDPSEELNYGDDEDI